MSDKEPRSASPALDGVMEWVEGMTKAEQTAHDPADVEYMARRFAYAFQPEGIKISDSLPPDWEAYIKAATRALDWMQANGVKMTTRDSIAKPYAPEGHDAANPTPRDRQ